MSTDRELIRKRADKIAKSNLASLKNRDMGINLNTYREILANDIEKLVTEATHEADIRGRIDEVKKIPYWGTPYGTEVFGYEKLFRDNRLAQLKRTKNKEEGEIS